jgi:GntR family transcriptional regulator of arabinose operon
MTARKKPDTGSVKPRPGPASELLPSVPKYRQILEDLRDGIESGRLKPGDKLQSEAELGAHYKASRITVAKAMNELMQLGLVSRRAGSGTHVLGARSMQGHVFGLLIPDLGRTEIFEPICQGMMRSPLARAHSLLWGQSIADGERQAQDALRLCQHYIAQRVAGVFFAPLEYTPEKDQANLAIAAALEKAEIPIVLLDRCYMPFPTRSPHDLVGIDNRATGYMITSHLLKLGVTRPAFVSRARSASSVLGRIAGYREALIAHGLDVRENRVCEGDVSDPAFVHSLLDELKPDGFVCSNDITAGRLILTLASLGVRVPNDMPVVGVDDVKYAELFSVALTTQHQNCSELGAIALATMLQRLEQPELPIRDVLLQTETIVRNSCGTMLKQ